MAASESAKRALVLVDGDRRTPLPYRSERLWPDTFVRLRGVAGRWELLEINPEELDEGEATANVLGFLLILLPMLVFGAYVEATMPDWRSVLGSAFGSTFGLAALAFVGLRLWRRIARRSDSRLGDGLMSSGWVPLAAGAWVFAEGEAVVGQPRSLHGMDASEPAAAGSSDDQIPHAVWQALTEVCRCGNISLFVSHADETLLVRASATRGGIEVRLSRSHGVWSLHEPSMRSSMALRWAARGVGLQCAGLFVVGLIGAGLAAQDDPWFALVLPLVVLILASLWFAIAMSLFVLVWWKTRRVLRDALQSAGWVLIAERNWKAPEQGEASTAG